jgi:hypothetical protein
MITLMELLLVLWLLVGLFNVLLGILEVAAGVTCLLILLPIHLVMAAAGSMGSVIGKVLRKTACLPGKTRSFIPHTDSYTLR